MQLDGLPEKVHGGVWRQNSAAAAKWRWTCSHVADAAPEWPALLAATTTATPMLRADPSYPTDEASWSTRSWLSLQAQRMSVALQLAAAEEIATELRLAAASEDAAVA
ncbi:hypothetical protein EMIHUDRAFT_240543 [Emiliania huxleyi CCMP1516]|uniref:Uncharacterized protein n=2 Tax=Emiliania huxleyi TaxID=2903 RepID=A0A0D3JEV3_EMIH1|nr:hypothetical protein EMIHUDRAFT_240543 [Emiliania huxleyi CCMP1516]EOD22038.1 hypothetical protein EMIHUDRAFT_240543 [Emiliania huxleyi CCMP1516]|eukprot:XP_005774467.1 hypothetical protein EMIHUDRAFT_240543 [Emiliania huxleyi CCMP1516]